jgi:putative transposase
MRRGRVPAFAGATHGVAWQRGYYEHVVRRSDALDKIRQYMLGNPARWEFDSENPNCLKQAQAPARTQSPDQ